ncbi:MAG: hypothetical protein P8125_09605 [Gemmatimonadota bacterium]
MSERIEITICGYVDLRRTVAELVRADSGEFVGLVYEDSDGWKQEIPDHLLSEAVLSAAEHAKATLSEYVNRRGENVPDGLTRAGLSLWLMEKSDGTAMGRPIR